MYNIHLVIVLGDVLLKQNFCIIYICWQNLKL